MTPSEKIACRHEGVEFPVRPVPDAWYRCSDCGEAVGQRDGRVVTIHENNELAEARVAQNRGAWEVLLVLVSLSDDDELEALEQTLDDESRADAVAALRGARREIEAQLDREDWWS